MPLYRYDSFNRRGARVSGTIDAASGAAAKELLRGQGLMPTTITEVGQDSARSVFMSLFEPTIDPKMVIIFTKQFAVLLRSSVPLLQALELLIEQFEGKFQRVLISIKDGVKSGESLAKELSKHPKIFSNVYVQLVKAGEASGKLDAILERLTEYLEKAAETKKRIKKAMSKPLMTLGLVGVVVVALLTMVVPSMMEMFSKMGKELPGPTQFLVNVSNLLTQHYLVLSIGILVFLMWGSYWKNTPVGRYRLDELFLKFPMTAYFSRTKAVVQFSQTLGMLIESGVNLAEALDIVCNIVDNTVLTKKLKEARDNIIKEGKIARYLKETGIFPNIALYMIGTGEQSGKLGHMLLTVGNDYEVALMELTDSLVDKINPIMTVAMGIIVGFIMIAIFLPIINMGSMVGV